MNNKNKEEIKIAYIGGGSRAWAPKLMTDLALCPFLKGELILYDIDEKAAWANVAVAESIFNHVDSKTKFKVRVAKTVKETLENADFVVMSIEPGSITFRYGDLEIPKKYGIIQTVGDTTGPGGIIRALRAIPIYEYYAHQIMLNCPKAWIINYSNPMSILTRTLYKIEPKIKAFGCCHEVFSTQKRLAEFVEDRFKVPKPGRSEIELDISGVNHFTLATAASWKGIDLFPYLKDMIASKTFFSDHTEIAIKRKEKEKWFDNDGLIAYDFLLRFNVLGAAGDRHLAEFVPWYLTSEENLHRWGIVLTPYKWRYERMQKLSKWDKNKPLIHSGEEGVSQILALLGIKPLVTNVNIPNHGQMLNIPESNIVETYAQFTKDNIRPIVSRALPKMIDENVRRVSQIQEIIVEGSIKKEKDLVFQAFLNDPLIRIQTDRAWEMFNEMLEYTKVTYF